MRRGPPIKKNKPTPIIEINAAFRALVLAGDRIVATGPLRVVGDMGQTDRFVVARDLM